MKIICKIKNKNKKNNPLSNPIKPKTEMSIPLTEESTRVSYVPNECNWFLAYVVFQNGIMFVILEGLSRIGTN